MSINLADNIIVSTAQLQPLYIVLFSGFIDLLWKTSVFWSRNSWVQMVKVCAYQEKATHKEATYDGTYLIRK